MRHISSLLASCLAVGSGKFLLFALGVCHFNGSVFIIGKQERFVEISVRVNFLFHITCHVNRSVFIQHLN